MKGIIAGGGTGGHFYPGFAIAIKLKSQGNKIVFAVKKDDISLNILKDHDIAFAEIDMIALPRSLNPLRYIRFFIKFIKSIIQSFRIINDFEPDFVFLTGSYISFSFIIPSYIKKIPLYIHESNTVFGLGNYISSFFARKIFLGLPVRNNRFQKKSILTGTPLRDIFFKPADPHLIKNKFSIPSSNRVIACFGGSQGSRNINNAVYNLVLDNQIQQINDITVIHITGKNNYASVKKLYEDAGILDKNLILLDYYENMNEIYAVSDLIISRSGASTVSELLYCKKPAILIPLPSATKNHQYENARFLFENGCAVIINDDENLPVNLIKKIRFLLFSNRLEVMKKSYRRIDIPPAEKTSEIIINNIIQNL